MTATMIALEASPYFRPLADLTRDQFFRMRPEELTRENLAAMLGHLHRGRRGSYWYHYTLSVLPGGSWRLDCDDPATSDRGDGRFTVSLDEGDEGDAALLAAADGLLARCHPRAPAVD